MGKKVRCGTCDTLLNGELDPSVSASDREGLTCSAWAAYPRKGSADDAFGEGAAQTQIGLADTVVTVCRISATRSEQDQAEDQSLADHRPVRSEQFRIRVLAK